MAEQIISYQAMPTRAGDRRLKVLAVEDDPFTLQILHKRLTSAGYEIRTAVNGRLALELFDQDPPDIVISDWMMPELDGPTLCERIRERPNGRNVYFMMLTARGKNEDKVAVLDLGADEYLVKPVDGQELVARLHAAERLLALQGELSRSNGELLRANQRINKELREISNIQRSLLPQRLPEVAGYLFAAHYQPSTECSGDFYDLLDLPGGRLGVVIGDVSGHGAPAMVAMALMRMIVRQQAAQCASPAELLGQINNQMFDHLPTGQFATMFYGVLEPGTGVLTYSSAGHPAPILLERGEGRELVLPGCEGYPIKLVERNVTYTDHKIEFPTGHTLILYTDGLTETFNPAHEIFQEERLRALLRAESCLSPDPLIERILDELDSFRAGRLFEDDLSLLVLARN